MTPFLFLLTIALLVVDYGQTRDIENHPGFSETNAILGLHPNGREIRVYFLVWVIIMGLVLFLPENLDQLVYAAVIAIEARTTWNNRKIGLKVKL